jgi:hypothetical protein
MKRWKVGTFTIKKRGRKTATLEGKIHPSGLFAVRRTTAKTARPWELTHVPTGYRAGSYITEADAKAVAQGILDSGTDWTLTSPKVYRAGTEQHAAAMRVISGVRNGEIR